MRNFYIQLISSATTIAVLGLSSIIVEANPRIQNRGEHQVLKLNVSNQKMTAKTILDLVYAHYKDKNNIKVNFSLKYSDTKTRENHSVEKGTLWLSQKENKYKITLDEQDYFSNGKSQWTVLKTANEIQINDFSNQDGQISPSNMFSFFQKGFDQKLVESIRINGQDLWVIELTPQKRNQGYQKIVMRINKAKKDIEDINVYDKNGGIMTYKILSLQELSKQDPSLFELNTKNYPGFEIVDLR